MWGVEWLRNLTGVSEMESSSVDRQFRDLRGFLNQIQEADADLARKQYRELKALLVGLHETQGLLLRRMERLMSKISDFAAAMNAFTDRQDAAVNAIVADVTWLKDKIDQLQNTPGEVSPEDQALLDAIQARAGAMADKVDALDALTPPAVPVTP